MITHDSEQLLTWLVCARTGGFRTDHADRHGSAGAAVTETVWQAETAALGWGVPRTPPMWHQHHEREEPLLPAMEKTTNTNYTCWVDHMLFNTNITVRYFASCLREDEDNQRWSLEHVHKILYLLFYKTSNIKMACVRHFIKCKEDIGPWVMDEQIIKQFIYSQIVMCRKHGMFLWTNN